MSSGLIIGLTAWALISIPLGLLLGKMIKDVSRDDDAHSGQVAFISKKQSKARTPAS